MYHIIAFTIMLVMIILVVGFVKFLDKPWIEAKGKKYRLYQVHGDMWNCWHYRLQKRTFLIFWSNVWEEYKTTKKSEQYYKWIKEYKMTVC